MPLRSSSAASYYCCAIENLCQSFLLTYGVRVGIEILLRTFKLSRKQSYSSLLDLKCNLQEGMEGNHVAKIIQPIDMMKLRIQLGLGSAGQVSRTMIKEEGFGSLYKDLSNQPRLLQTQLSEIKKRLSCWTNPDKINRLGQMEDSIRESRNQIRTHKYLDENKSLILKIVESQNSGKLSECAE